MPLTIPGEYTGPLVRTGWIQFIVVKGYTTMRLRCLQVIPDIPPFSSPSSGQTVQCNVLSMSSTSVSLYVREKETDQPFLRTATISGSTATVIKTAETTMSSGVYTNYSLMIGNEFRSISGNTATDITVGQAFSTIPAPGTAVQIRQRGGGVTLIPPMTILRPGCYTKVVFSAQLPIIEFWGHDSLGDNSDGPIRVQLESNMRFEILPFDKDDAFFPQHIVTSTYPPWNTFLP